MGACCAKPEDSYQSNESKPKKRKSGGGKKDGKKEVPDFGFGEVFDVVKLLGAGGEGETWLCIDKELNKEVAIKVGGGALT
jgi:serine/threonine-protein kinase SRK2